MGGPRQTWNSAEASSKRLKEAEKVASPITKFAQRFAASTRIAGAGKFPAALGWLQTNRACTMGPGEYWECAGLAARCG